MNLAEGVRVAFHSLWAYKLRSFLTVLGNIVAVTSVIAVVSLIDGMDGYVRTEIAQEGSNVLTLRRADDLQVLTDFDAFLESLHNPDITLDDYRALRESDLASVDRLAAFARARGRVQAGGRSANDVPVAGWTADYPDFHDFELREGRHFNEFENRSSRSVAVIGSEIADRIVRGETAVGKTIRLNGRHVEVVGVLEERAGFLGGNPNRQIFVPLGRHLKIFGGRQSLSVRLRVVDGVTLEDATDEIRGVMRIRHRLRPEAKDDFAVTSADRIVDLWKSVSRMIFTALILLVSISLVVGGVVIMNIMLVSVTERTREIGTRKALGARRVDVLWQFLVESVSLSMVGGVLGILIGFLLAGAVARFSPLPYAVRPWAVFAGLAVTFLVGIFFGLYPANRAARLDPVEALRRE